MKKFNLILLLTFLPLLIFSQKKDSEFTYIEDEYELDLLVPVIKDSETIGRCCQLGKVLSKVTGGITDFYTIQSEKNLDGSYTIFYLNAVINYDKHLTRYGDNYYKVVEKFHLADEEKFNRFNYLMVEGTKGFKTSPVKTNHRYIEISEILEGGNDEGARLFLHFSNDKIIKFVSVLKFDKDSGYKSQSVTIFSKFIQQLFGSDKVID